MRKVTSSFKGVLALEFPNMHANQFFDFCQLNKDLRIERNAEGQVIIMPLKSLQIGNLSAQLNVRLGLWNKERRLGVAFINAGFTLPNGAVYGPNSAWLSTEKWNSLTKEQQKKFAPVVPDFIMELRSPNDNVKPIEDKILEFMECGCRLAWLIDPIKQQTTIYKSDGSETKVSFNELLSGEDVLPGFEVKLSELFE